MRRLLALALGLPAVAAAALSATPALADPAPPVAHHVLSNGLDVAVVERHAAPLVTVEIAVHNGAMAEPPEYNGLSHLYEHMFFKGNAVLPDQLAYLARLRDLGGEFNGSTGNERVNYFFTTTSDHLADTMRFMHDAITSPLFDPKELEQERVVVTGEIDRNESDPEYYLEHEVEKRSFWKYASRKDALGLRKTVLGTTPAMMRTIQHRYYVPNNAILVVVGDVKAEDVFRQADALYVDWKAAPDPFKAFPIPAHPPIRKSEVVLVQQPVQTFKGYLTWHGPQTSDASLAQTYAADLLSAICRDPSSTFQHDLVDSGKCVRADLGYDSEAHTGEINVTFEAAESRVDDCTMAVFQELGKLASPELFTDGEMQNAVHRSDVSLAAAREISSAYAHLLTSYWAIASLDYYATYVDHLKAVTRADIGRFVADWITGKPFVLGAMVSPKLASMGIDRAHVEGLAGLGKPGKKVSP